MNTAPLIQHHVTANRIHALAAFFTIVHLSKFCPIYPMIFLKGDFPYCGAEFWSNPHDLDGDKVSLKVV